MLLIGHSWETPQWSFQVIKLTFEQGFELCESTFMQYYYMQ